MTVLALCPDLMFSSKLSGAAQRGGWRLEVFSQAQSLVARCETAPDEASGDATLIVLDLTTAGLQPDRLIPQLRAAEYPPRAILAFGPHVHTGRLDAAKAAGCDAVFTRGHFNSEMDAILAASFGGEEA
jgi:DNA-binding NarL/FixJ family response regulator